MKINKTLVRVAYSLFALLLLSPAIVFGAGEFCKTAKNIKDLSLKIGGSLVAVGWVIAGIIYLTAGGGEKMATGKKALIAAVIGTILVIVAATAATIIGDAIQMTSSLEC